MRISSRAFGPCRAIAVLLWLLSAVGLLTSCRQKDLMELDSTPLRVTVKFDWSKAENADPDGMSLYFFPADKFARLWRFDISDRDGGDIELPMGSYRMIAVNNDLKGVEFADADSFDKFRASARFYAGDSLSGATGMLYAATVEWVDITPTGQRVITARPDSLSTVYHVRLDSVSGFERIKNARIELGPVARYVLLSTESNSSEQCIMSASLQTAKAGDTGVLSGTATAFGLPGKMPDKFSLRVVVNTSLATYSKIFNITQQIRNQKDRRNVVIHITGLDIPPTDSGSPAGPGVGIDVGVDGWEVIEINY